LSVRLSGPNLKAIAAWLGILALNVNALLPVHLAFDLADALAGERHEQACPWHQHDGRHLLAALAGHHDSGGKSGAPSNRSHIDCFVCGSLSALAGFAGSAGIALPTPTLVDTRMSLAAATVELRGASTFAYRSRAPPNG
jgi:hypothetical protein